MGGRKGRWKRGGVKETLPRKWVATCGSNVTVEIPPQTCLPRTLLASLPLPLPPSLPLSLPSKRMGLMLVWFMGQSKSIISNTALLSIWVCI
jgi:hypothetical protein